MNQKGGRRVVVALQEGSDISEIDVLKLLSEAEIDLSSVHFMKDDDGAPSIAKDDALVVPLFDQQTADVKVEAAVLEAARAGSCQIVGVWAPGQQETAIHPAVLEFGTSQIPWAADQLQNELGSDCANAFQTPDGEEAERNGIEPHECE